MSEGKNLKLIKVAKEFNVGIPTIIEFLKKKNIAIDSNPNTKVTDEVFALLVKEYSSDSDLKKESKELSLKSRERKETIALEDFSAPNIDATIETEDTIFINDTSSKPAEIGVKIIGKIDIEPIKKKKEVSKEIPAPQPPVQIIKPEDKKPSKKVVAEQPQETTSEIVKEETIVAEKKKAKDNPIEEFSIERVELEEPKVLGKIDLNAINQKTRPAKKSKKEKDEDRKQKDILEKELKRSRKNAEIIKEKVEDITTDLEEVALPEKQIIPEEKGDELFHTIVEKLSGPTVLGRMDLPAKEERKPPVLVTNADREAFKKKKRKRIKKEKEKETIVSVEKRAAEAKESPFKKKAILKGDNKHRIFKVEVNDEEVQKQMKETLSSMGNKNKSKTSKYRKEKREGVNQKMHQEMMQQEADKNILNITEFVTVNELATLMNVPVTQIIGTCMNLGLFVSINQRLDADTMVLVAEEFGFTIEFVSIDALKDIIEEIDNPEDLLHRPPIVTVMGHVDHGKTKLLDYIRSANVVAGEAGGITQHIGAYHVQLENGRQITFLDTPGHEAFTAMRARGAKVTDIAIIVIAADDNVMPQTIEAINHAQAAGVPIIFAINKIDKPTANPEKIKEELAKMNLLVEDWGGKYQCQEIAAKPGLNVDLLLEKVILEADMLELKANPNKRAVGTVIESSLDKGRGYVSTLLISAGTLKIGDIILAGSYTGSIKAMFNERGVKVKEAGPSQPILILGLNGAPQAGDPFNVMENEREAREIANKREQLLREQGLRTQKHITLDEIGRRLKVGNFKEINLIVKGDVDGSIEALSDSLIKLSNEEIQVTVIHKAVGQISESDVMLATASNAIIVGFQVRPSLNARKLAEKEQIEIRLYSIIYNAIEELKDAMEGMLSPDLKEDILGTAEIKEVFNISKVGNIAGCLMLDGKISRASKIRVIRDGIVIHTGSLGSLKRFKDEAKDVSSGMECGLNVDKFNDIKVGDLIEAFSITEVKKKLK